MKRELESSEITPSEWLSINQFLYKIKQINNKCVSVYYPYGKGKETISLLKETKKNPEIEKIELKIEKRIIELRKNPSSVGKFTKTFVVFGWIEKDQVILKEIGISKELPYVYMVSKKPFLKPFYDVLKTHKDILLVILDQKSAQIQRFHGTKVVQESKLKIDLRGRHKKGGQSQGRFLRARQTKIHVFYKKVANKIKTVGSDSELILIGGGGQAKTEFFDEINSELLNKCRFVENISFSTPRMNVYKKIIQHLYKHRKKHVEEVIEKYEKLVKNGLTVRANTEINKALKQGAVDTLIVSTKYHTSSNFKTIMKMLEIAKQMSTKIEFASSPKIINKLKVNDSVLAILRYKIK